MRLKTKIKNNYKKIILDFIPAFLGVLVALFLSNWNQQRKENDFIRKSIVSIYNENKSNLENIEIQIDHLQHQQDTFKHYRNSKSLTISEIIGKNNGLQTQNIKHSSLKILTSSQLITQIDYETISLLSEIEEGINNLYTYRIKVFEMGYNLLESKNKNDKFRINLMINDFLRTSRVFQNDSKDLDSLLMLKYPKIIAQIED